MDGHDFKVGYRPDDDTLLLGCIIGVVWGEKMCPNLNVLIGFDHGNDGSLPRHLNVHG